MAGMGQKWATLDSESKVHWFESSIAHQLHQGSGRHPGAFFFADLIFRDSADSRENLGGFSRVRVSDESSRRPRFSSW
jgi:hypothetical protein